MGFRVGPQAEPIPGYKLIERLGGGGFGEVWKAEAPGGLFKAIKFVYGDLQTVGEDANRAEQELKGLSRVRSVHHPYILSLERYDIIDGQLIIVMELADRTLWDRFKECRTQGLVGIPRAELLDYIHETAEALDLMYTEYQLQHLDIKPQNIFLIYNHIKVADFGLVKDLEGRTGATVTGGVTPVYAAPETFDGIISRYSDQYSLAIVFQELLTGTRPFFGSTMKQLVLQHLQAVPDVSPLPEKDRAIISRALSKEPEDRFPSCLEMINALRECEKPANPPFERKDYSFIQDKPEVDFPGEDGHATVRGPGKKDNSAKMDVPVLPQDVPGELGLEGLGARNLLEEARISPSGMEEIGVKIPQEVALPSSSEVNEHPSESLTGITRPALVIGLGQLGIDTLRELRKSIHEEYGRSDALPHLRLLALDTDPEAVQGATQGDLHSFLRGPEVLHTRLHRPSHYLKGREDKTTLDGWLDMRMIYRIPRQPTQAGARSLGRLAFVDNYRTIYRRLEAELQACCADDTLQEISQQPELGLRTRQPRVYVVTSLAGTTGGGMFLDVAYVVRQILRKQGWGSEVVGLFYLPPVGNDPVRMRALANTYAALAELQHFSSGQHIFRAKYMGQEAGLGPAKSFSEAGPPFQRCYLLNLPERRPGSLNSVHDAGAAVGLGGEFIFRELTTPLGREIETRRPQAIGPTQFFSFGLCRLVWPRRQILEKAGRRLCGRLIDRWLNKNASSISEELKSWSLQQWENQDFGTDKLIALHQEKCERLLKQSPETMFGQVINSLAQELQSQGKEGSPRLNIGPVVQTLDQLEKLLGIPDECRAKGATPEPGVIEKALNEVAARIGDSCDKKLAEMVVRHLIEEPRYRLVGAEEALRQFTSLAEKALQTHEHLVKEFHGKAILAFQKIHKILENPCPNVQQTPPSRWKGAFGRRGHVEAVSPENEILELMRSYAKFRFQGLVLHHITRLYVGLRGLLSDQIREVGFCRQRLMELAKLMEDKADTGSLEDGRKGRPRSEREKFLLPAGCVDQDDAINQLENILSKEDLLAFDQVVQQMLQQQFQALVHVCMGPPSLVKSLAPVMIHEAENFLGSRLAGTSVAEMFLAQFPQKETSDSEIREELLSSFDEAAPELVPSSLSEEIAIITLPGGEAGMQLRSHAHRALPTACVLTSERTDEILLFREQGPVPLAELEQLGPLGQEAYRKRLASDPATVHTREDIPEWQLTRET